MDDFFQIFVISRSCTEILIELNFWLGMYVPYILKYLDMKVLNQMYVRKQLVLLV